MDYGKWTFWGDYNLSFVQRFHCYVRRLSSFQRLISTLWRLSLCGGCPLFRGSTLWRLSSFQRLISTLWRLSSFQRLISTLWRLSSFQRFHSVEVVLFSEVPLCGGCPLFRGSTLWRLSSFQRFHSVEVVLFSEVPLCGGCPLFRGSTLWRLSSFQRFHCIIGRAKRAPH